jgi:hypothetical protein
MLTTMSLSPAITGIADLKGRSVGAWEEYAQPLSTEMGMSAVPFAWSNKQVSWPALHGKLCCAVY